MEPAIGVRQNNRSGETMKIVGVCGSCRKDSNSEHLMKVALEPFCREGMEVRIHKVGNLDLSPCCGCERCRKEGKCCIEDDIQYLYEDLYWTDAIVIASPVYYRNIPSKLAAIFERAYAYQDNRPLEGKLGAAIAVGRGTGGGQSIVLSVIHNWLLSAGALCVPGELNGLSAVADGPGDILKDQRKLDQAIKLGGNLLRFSKIIFEKPK